MLSASLSPLTCLTKPTYARSTQETLPETAALMPKRMKDPLQVGTVNSHQSRFDRLNAFSAFSQAPLTSEADQQLVDILRRDDFQGPRYDKAAAGWWSYGWRIMAKWTRTGEVFHRSRQAGRPIPAEMITTT